MASAIGLRLASTLSVLRPTVLAGHHRALSVRNQAAVGRVQHIYELALDGNLAGAAEAMDGLTAAECGLIADGPDGAPGGPICYHHIHSDAALSIGIFVLPKGACLPLHDHPRMTVLSKLLFGSLEVTSYDQPSAPPAQSSGSTSLLSLLGRSRGAREPHILSCGSPRRRTVSAPCEPLRLEPVSGNIHAFNALEHTAIFDVLTPPYNDLMGRSCHYYEELGEVVREGSEALGMELLEVPWPRNLRVVNRPYIGDPVVG